MAVMVRYYSHGGNTRRLAEAVGKALGAPVFDVSAPMDTRADTLFLCASVYGGLPDKSVIEFIRDNAPRIGRIVVLSTSATGRSTHGRIKAAAADVGVQVAENHFHCPGAWTLFHRGRPNADDCARAAAFAQAQL